MPLIYTSDKKVDVRNGLPIFNSHRTFFDWYCRTPDSDLGTVPLLQSRDQHLVKHVDCSDTPRQTLHVYWKDHVGLKIHNDDSIEVQGYFSMQERRYFQFFIENIWPGVSVFKNTLRMTKHCASAATLSRACEEMGNLRFKEANYLFFHTKKNFSLNRAEDGGLDLSGWIPTYKDVSDAKLKAKARGELRDFLKYCKIYERFPMQRSVINELKVNFNKDPKYEVKVDVGLIEMFIQHPRDKDLWPVVAASYHRPSTYAGGYEFDKHLMKRHLYDMMYAKYNATSFVRDPYGHVSNRFTPENAIPKHKR